MCLCLCLCSYIGEGYRLCASYSDCLVSLIYVNNVRIFSNVYCY